MKYKVGDKVRIRTGLVVDKFYQNISFVRGMKDWEGKVVTIETVKDWYEIKEDKDRIKWAWTDEMLESVSAEKTFPRMMLVSDTGLEGPWSPKKVVAYCKEEEYPWITKVDSDEFLGYKFAKERPAYTKKHPAYTKKIKKLKAKVAKLSKKNR